MKYIKSLPIAFVYLFFWYTFLDGWIYDINPEYFKYAFYAGCVGLTIYLIKQL